MRSYDLFSGEGLRDSSWPVSGKRAGEGPRDPPTSAVSSNAKAPYFGEVCSEPCH